MRWSLMTRMRYLSLLILSMTTGLCQAQGYIEGVRTWSAPESTRLVFDVNKPLKYRIFSLSNPSRLVIDVDESRLRKPLEHSRVAKGMVKKLRSASRSDKHLRIVLDLNGKVRPKSFALKPNKRYGHRLVVDLHHSGKHKVSKPKIKRADEVIARTRPIVVAIDAGHGGDDPGAIGPRGTQEKVVVLAIAKKLNAEFGRDKAYRTVMIRNGDYYVGLKKRTKKARSKRADLFISIHADAFRDHRANGASVYALSERGASSKAAKVLAAKENSADLIGGISLDDKDDLLASVLLDLSQTATIDASLDIGSNILSRLKGVVKLHKRRVEQAGFRVLKSPDIPSVLVETAFISNYGEERKLRNSTYQRSLARALADGVKSYFKRSPPPGTLMAKRRASERKHVVSRGDTLSGIAAQYHVRIDTLKSINQINGSHLREGAILQIPSES